MAKHNLGNEIAPGRSFRFGAIFLCALGILVVGYAGLKIQDSQAAPISAPAPTVSPSNVPTLSPEPSPSASLDPNPNLTYAEYVRFPKSNTRLGTLTFPTLGESMPIIEGTGKAELRKGAGHYLKSVLPGMRDNSVISGHRETVFKNLGKLKIGDQVVAKTSAGTFTYQVIETRIVDDEDRTVIVPTDEAILTLTTCYPFTPYGPKPERYIVSAQLIESN